MARRTAAMTWGCMDPDDTGTLVSVEYTCPYCGNYNTELYFVSYSNLDIITKPFENDQVCKWCDKKVTIECDEYNKRDFGDSFLGGMMDLAAKEKE